MTAGRVAGKSIVVTGGAQGIGRACAELLAAEGARVTIGDLDDRRAEAVCLAIRGTGGEATFQHTDVAREEDCSLLIDHAVATWGRLDGLVNNAGWFPRASMEETDAVLWRRVLAVNLDGAFFCCKHAVPEMRRAGGGSIVNMGSVNGIQGLPSLIAYASAKGGMLSMTRTIAGAYSADRIRANYVIPGWVLTETEIALQHTLGLSDDDLERAGEALPLGRHQTPQDVASAVLFLLSDESSQITGTILQVDAGRSSLPHSASYLFLK